MEQELRELGNRLMWQAHDEWLGLVSEDEDCADPRLVLDGMNNVELLAVMYATGTAGEAFESVIDDVADCVAGRIWAFQ